MTPLSEFVKEMARSIESLPHPVLKHEFDYLLGHDTSLFSIQQFLCLALK